MSASNHGIADQGLQGINFQLSQRSVSTQEGGLRDSKGLSNHEPGDLGGKKDSSLCIQGKEQVQKETYRVPWPNPEETNAHENVPEHEQIITDQQFPKGVDSLCSLAIERDSWADIVAFGNVYIPNEGEVVKHHFKTVPNGHYRVCIIDEINPNALLPCPEGEIRFICQGKDMFFI
ncbi:hypothetical protein vseg_001977 [Gypsophila vaccaria]